MRIRHLACQQPIAHRLLLGDDGDPAIVRWCEACDAALNDNDCDPAVPLEIAEIPAGLVAQLIQIGVKPASKLD